MMSSLREKVLHFVKRKRRNNHDTSRGSDNNLDSDRLVSNSDKGSRENGEECSTLASAYHLVHDARRLVLISSTLCSHFVSMREYQVEFNHRAEHKVFSLYVRIP